MTDQSPGQPAGQLYRIPVVVHVTAYIRPCAHIHDAQYYLIPDDMGTLRYVNEHLVREVEWQDHPVRATPTST